MNPSPFGDDPPTSKPVESPSTPKSQTSGKPLLIPRISIYGWTPNQKDIDAALGPNKYRPKDRSAQ